jgi:hypothetical protein
VSELGEAWRGESGDPVLKATRKLGPGQRRAEGVERGKRARRTLAVYMTPGERALLSTQRMFRDGQVVGRMPLVEADERLVRVVQLDEPFPLRCRRCGQEHPTTLEALEPWLADGRAGSSPWGVDVD